jgi:hypothetical protein
MTDKASAVNDFGDIAKRLRELSGAEEKLPGTAPPQAPAKSAPNWGGVCNDQHCVCLGEGWLYQHAQTRNGGRAWKIAVCPVCGNPEKRRQPA